MPFNPGARMPIGPMAGNIGTSVTGGGGVQMPTQVPQQGTGFGSYLQSLHPLEAIAMATSQNPIGQLAQGYGGYRKETESLNMVRKFDELMTNDPEITNADWGDPDFAQNALRIAVARGVPSPVAEELLDNYYLKENNAMYYDQELQKIVAHSQIEPGRIISGERYARIDLDKAKTNPIYRNYLVQTYPGIKPWVEDALGKVSPDKAALNDFKKKYEKDGARPLIAELGIDVFMTVHGKAYGREYKPFPEAVRRAYDEIGVRTGFMDKHMTDQDRVVVKTVNDALAQLLKAEESTDTKPSTKLDQADINENIKMAKEAISEAESPEEIKAIKKLFKDTTGIDYPE